MENKGPNVKFRLPMAATVAPAVAPAVASVPSPPHSLDARNTREVIQLDVSGMTCANCASSVERALAAVPGVGEASVNFALRRAQIRFDPDRTGLARLEQAVETAGYHA